ncbi:NME7, partial [Symbiodinium sp. KB8]
LGRQLTIVDYQDAPTRAALAADHLQCFGWLPVAGVGRLGALIEACAARRLRLSNCRSVDLSPDDAEAFLGSADAAGFGLALRLQGSDARDAWADVAADPPSGIPRGALWVAATERQDEAAIEAFFEPALRGSATAPAAAPAAATGAGGAGTMASTSQAAAAEAAAAAWGDTSTPTKLCPSARRSTAQLCNCTAALVLPHVMAGGGAGEVVQATLDGATSRGLRVTAASMIDLDPVTAEELLEVYKGVEPAYAKMVTSFAQGPCLALELSGDGAVRKMREVAGPRDVDVARKVRPDTIRAIHGEDTSRCAIHVTDLEEDGPLDCEYLFSLL